MSQLDFELDMAKVPWQGDETGDWAADAGVAEMSGKPAYRVDVLKDGKLQSVATDPHSGKPLLSRASGS